jgi:uncharacterized membrane protein YgaE (UPF0421/DUF939 family)
MKIKKVISQIYQHWFGRLTASDPGLQRFQHASRIILSVISSIFTMLFILKLFHVQLLTASILSGLVGMLGIAIVTDETVKQKQVTTLLLGISSATAVTIGTSLSNSMHLVDFIMLLIIFLAFYVQQFGSRFFTVSMIAFMSIYFSALLKLQSEQLPWFYLSILVGVVYAFIYHFVIIKSSPKKILKRSLKSFHIQTNLTFNIIMNMIEDPYSNHKRLLGQNVQRLNDYARMISGELATTDPSRIWPGVSSNELRLYVFDAQMLIETLTDAINRLKELNALEHTELRRLLTWVVRSLRDTEVLSESYQPANLEEAEKAIQGLRLTLNELHEQNQHPEEWLYLIRRIESISNHVIDGATVLQQSIQCGKVEDRFKIGNAATKENVEVETTGKDYSFHKKAIQAFIAGALSIVLGYAISPAHPYWILLTAFLVLLGTESVGRTYLKGFQRSYGTILGAIVGFGLAKLVEGHIVPELFLLFMSIFFAHYFFAVSYTTMSFLITMLVSFMYDILLGGISGQLLIARVFDTLIGAAIAVAVSTVLFPRKTKDRVADASVDFLAELKVYLSSYLESFIDKSVTPVTITDKAFKMDEKLQEIRDEAKSILKKPGSYSRSGIIRWLTVLIAIHYYAKHLIASSNRKIISNQNEELSTTLKHVDHIIQKNIDSLCQLIKGKETSVIVWGLEKERELIERSPEKNGRTETHMIHYLYYIWRINQTIVSLATDLGAKKQSDLD